MANKLVDKLTTGPGAKDLIKAMLLLVTKTEPKRIPMFGNGYRQFPVRITDMKVHAFDAQKMTVDLQGVIDYRNFPSIRGIEHVQGRKVRIVNYDAHTRIAESSAFVE